MSATAKLIEELRGYRMLPAILGEVPAETAVAELAALSFSAADTIARLEEENGRLKAEVKRLTTPDSYWDWNDPECGYCDISEALSDAPMGGVVRLMTGKNLGDVWATTRVLTVDEDGDWDDHEVAVFDNPADAEKCWTESLAAARALSTGDAG